MEKQEEKTNVVDNEQSNLSVENQKVIEHSDELTLTK